MFHFTPELKVSTSKFQTQPLAQVNSHVCDQCDQKATCVSILDSFIAESSMNASPAKMVYDTQSGREKDFRRKTFIRTKNSEKKEKEKARLRKMNEEKPATAVSYKTWKKSREFQCISHMRPHAGFEEDIPNLLIDVLSRKFGIHRADDIVKEIEGLMALLAALATSKTVGNAMASIFLYIRTKFTTSVSSILCHYVRTQFGFGTQSGDENCESEPSWMRLLRNLRGDWAACRTNGVFDNFCKVLSVLVVAGLANVSDLTFNLGKFKIIEPNLRLLTGNASDLLTAICDIVVFFAERCYFAWKEKSFAPFFRATAEANEIEIEYNNLVNYWDLYKNGNLTKIARITEHDFLRRLEDMGDALRVQLATMKGIEKRLIEDKYRNIVKIIGQFTLIKVNSGFRRSPFTVEYYGLSKVGKSTVSEQISHYLLTSAGLSTDEGRKYTHVSGKKHWDGARSDMLELKLDDHANAKAEFVESSPCDVIIKVCNNVPYSPPMADISEKGKVWIEPELVSLTTNVLDLDARIYSNNPYSIQRRMHYVIDVKVKSEFVERSGDATLGIDTKKVIESHCIDGVYCPPKYHDIWDLTVMRAMPGDRETTSGTYAIVSDGDEKLENVSLLRVCNFLTERFHQHRQQQEQLEDNQRMRVDDSRLCGVDGCYQLFAHCNKHNNLDDSYTTQFGFDDVCRFVRDEGDDALSGLLIGARQFYNAFDWVPFVPDWILSTQLFRDIYALCTRYDMVDTYTRWTILNLIICIFNISMVMFWSSNKFVACVSCCFSVCLFCVVQVVMIQYCRDWYYQRLRRRKTLGLILQNWRSTLLATLIGGGTLFSCFYLFAKFMKVSRSFSVNGSLEPKTKDDVLHRDSEGNVWTQVSKRSLPMSHASSTTTLDRLQNAVQGNLLYGSIRLDDSTNARMNALMLSSNLVLVPQHYFDEFGDTLFCTFYKAKPETSGGKFSTRLELANSHHVPDSDLCICYVPNGGSFRNIIQFFPISRLPQLPFKMIWRKKDGDLIEAKGLTIPGRPRTTRAFPGGTYKNLTMNTFGGLCGAPILSDTLGTCIVGVHLGGHDGTTEGCYGSLLQSDINQALFELRKIEGTMFSGSAEECPTNVLGVDFTTQSDLHVKSPLRYMPQNSQIEYFGSCIGRSVFRSCVKVTPISEFVTDVCGVPNIYGPPVTNPEWKGWQDCLSNMALPGRPFPHSLLSVSVFDYKEDLLPIFRSPLWNGARPLTDHENLCGVPGEKFLDAIKLDTSVGYPLTGPKRPFVRELEPTPDKPNNRELDELIMCEIKRCEDLYARGERAYPIAKACKKDEILSKPKCRIFYGNALALTYLIRKYYLPILRVLQMNPLKAECAVGINAHGPEWEQFHTHVYKFGESRLFGGDYGKYDQKLPSQMIFAALRILIDFAKECQYTAKDLRIMEAMTGDIVFSLIAFNGDLIGLTEGAHISGNSLTVVINGICGSLNLRCFFYSRYPVGDWEKRMKFRDHVAIMTYGDDNIGSVAETAPEFTIKNCSHFLAEYGQEYTMPDKESDLLDYLPPDDFEFLKRKSVYHPDLGLHVGALLHKSIYKSLHCFMRPKGVVETEAYASALNVDTALREWFNHGRDVYETQRELMHEVCNRAGISHMCDRLGVTYDECVLEWREKYTTGD